MKTPNDLTIKAIRAYAGLAKTMHDTALTHGLVILAEGTGHVCKPIDEPLNGLPGFSDDDMRAFFAYERAVLENFRIVREGMKAAGLPVEAEEMTKEKP